MRGLNQATLIGNLSNDPEINGGKGQKDRDLPLPHSLLELLREQFRQFRPVTFLFEGQQPGEPYSPRNLQQVV